MYKPKDSIRYASRKMLEQAMAAVQLQMKYHTSEHSYIMFKHLLDAEACDWLVRFRVRDSDGYSPIDLRYSVKDSQWTLGSESMNWSASVLPGMSRCPGMTVSVHEPDFDQKLASAARSYVDRYISHIKMVMEQSKKLRGFMSRYNIRVYFADDAENMIKIPTNEPTESNIITTAFYGSAAVEAGLISDELSYLYYTHGTGAAPDTIEVLDARRAHRVWRASMTYERTIRVNDLNYNLAHIFGLQLYGDDWALGWQNAYTRNITGGGGPWGPTKSPPKGHMFTHEAPIKIMGTDGPMLKISISAPDYMQRLAEFAIDRIDQCEAHVKNHIFGVK